LRSAATLYETCSALGTGIAYYKGMNTQTQTRKQWAAKKLDIAIDKLIDVQSEGFGSDALARAIELLNQVRNNLYVY